MRLRFLHLGHLQLSPAVGETVDYCFEEGETADVPDDVGRRFIESGVAEPVVVEVQRAVAPAARRKAHK